MAARNRFTVTRESSRVVRAGTGRTRGRGAAGQDIFLRFSETWDRQTWVPFARYR
jgi:hypothetical protein